ncbi:hypothetical protein [Pectobacterium versatile]|uniref:hypothetical protein n=1 Tax=Pectobacterium versatile TaxID=2488639 RepID=UPI000E302A0C|nr:hypothetical protein [Pectobacterium versatile]
MAYTAFDWGENSSVTGYEGDFWAGKNAIGRWERGEVRVEAPNKMMLLIFEANTVKSAAWEMFFDA